MATPGTGAVIDSGMSVAADEAPDEPVLIPVVADGTDQSALINLMLATSTASVLELPPGDYWIGSNIYIPEGKTLVGAGQGLTTLHFLATFDAHVDNRAIVLGDRAGLSDLTVNGEKVGLGLSSAERICGVIGAGVDFLVERVSVVNTTGYAFWAFGNNDTTRPPASGVFRDCYAENANVLFETSDADGVLFERCVGADGDGDIAVASAFHPAAGSQNVSFVDCEYEGAGPVIDVLANLGDQAGILFQNVRGTTTGPADAVYIVGDGRSQVTIVDSSIVALQGYALFVQNSDLLAVRSSFETPRIGAWFDRNSTGYFAGSEISAIAAPGSLGLNYAIFTEGSVLWEGGEISVEGPLGSAAYRGNVTVVEATVVVQGVQEPDGPKNVVVGGPGAGEVHGTAGDDAVYSNEESPAYARPLGSGVFVAPVLDTSAEVDSLFGEAGDDRLFAGYGDNVDGGAGYDTLLVSFQGASGRVIASFNAAGGVVSTTVAGATITGIEAIEWVEGSEYDDLLIVGNAAADHAPMFGMGGDDYLAAGADSGSLFGGEGNDTIDLLDALNPADHFGEAGDDRVMGGIADDRIFGGEGEDEIAGNDGADHLDGGDGADLIDGGGGNDSIVGGAGDDHLEGGAGNDFLLLQDGGDDLALGGDGNDVIYFGSGVSAGDVADGGDGRDAVVFQGYVTAVLNDTNLVGIESISIQSGANATFGDAANNFYRFDITTADGNVAAGQQLIVNAQSLRDGEYFTFDGSAESDGSFLIYAGHGVDRLTGGAGVDVFLFEGQRWGAIDRVDGGPGRDALVISSGNGLNRIEFGAESFINIESISLNNRYATDPSQKPSYDLLFNDGNVAPGATLIVNGSSIPLGQVVNIDGRGELDGNLILFGGSGHDVIRAGAGNDLLYGGGGQDSLAGSAGADVFRYAAVSDSPAAASDQISDFQTGIDMIDLGRIDADSTTDGDQAFSWIGAEAFSGAAGELRLTEENGRQRIEGDVDGDGIADFAILFQLGTAPVVQSDFLF